MNQIIRTGSLACLLFLLAGCNLKITIEGEGSIVALNGNTLCDQPNCTVTNNGLSKEYAMQAIPAAGYTNIGIMSHSTSLFRATEDYYFATDIGYAPIVYSYSQPSSISQRQGRLSLDETANAADNTAPANIPTPYLNITYRNDITAIFLPTEDIENIYYGYLSACVHLVEDSIQCWGRHYDEAPESFQNIYLVKSISDAICAADDNGLRCWGRNSNGLTDAPSGLSQVIDIVFSNRQACALHQDMGENRVTCWGEYTPDIPQLSNPTSIRSQNLYNAMCATDDNGDVCWGGGYYGQSKVPTGLTNVTDFSVAETHTCAIADGAVHCWGLGFDLESLATQVPEGISNPVAISTSPRKTCVIEDAGITCWGVFDTEAPVLAGQPVAIDVTTRSICAADDTTLSCNFDNRESFTYSYSDLKQFDTGNSWVCYLDGSLADCHNYPYFSEQLQSLINPTLITLYDTVLCYYSDDGLLCDKNFTFNDPIEDVPELPFTPDAITANTQFACAYQYDVETNQSLFQCWGEGSNDEGWSSDNRGQFDIPAGLGELSKVESGLYHTCGLSGNQLHCWGELPPPTE
ncbi:MAG: hypothetical protein MI976_15540 [Pseudomonadales bacterium]|nr:hypothetical protein [Pseudomonadales bacterium]